MIEQRIARLRAFLQEHDADGVIIVQPENLRYFSAFTGGEGALVIGLDQAVLWTDSRYTEQAANQSGAWYDIKNHHNALSASIRSSLNDMEIGVAAYEENFLTHFMYENISDGALCGFLPCDLTSLRAVKEPYELKATRKASNIADRAFADL
ncbi:aminopeptidase P family N-terminal domain-containing protein, partial [Megasphaera sp.]